VLQALPVALAVVVAAVWAALALHRLHQGHPTEEMAD
jgi:hypothetical protein